MKFKVFSLIAGVFIILIVLMGGTYYYIFEYFKPQTLTTNSYQNEEKPLPNYIQNQTQEDDNLISNQNSQVNDDSTAELFSQPNQMQQENQKYTLNENNMEQNSIQNPTNLPQTQHNFSQSNPNEENAQTNVELSPIKEYQQRGKNNRLEPKLSSEAIKVYVLKDKTLSHYRINLLKDILKPVQNRSKDYKLSVFIEILPESKMDINIYNKDIFFSNKRIYKYIKVNKIAPYLSNPEQLNRKVAREEIMQRINFQSEEGNKGSDFSRHIKSLKEDFKVLNISPLFARLFKLIPVKTIGENTF